MAGNSLRLAKSPDAPKITAIQGSATRPFCVIALGSETLPGGFVSTVSWRAGIGIPEQHVATQCEAFAERWASYLAAITSFGE